jgi:diaminopimelate decarboxylase
VEEFRFKQNELWCEEANLAEVARRFGTPLYVYSKRSVIDHCRHIEKTFRSIDHLSCYAVKANANKEILRILAGEKIGADVGSLGELRSALSAGFLPDKITFSGVGKRDDEIEYALRNNILSFNVESEEEISVINEIASRLNTTARILLRVNFDIHSNTHPYITTGRKHNKFGVHQSQAKDILRRARTFSHIEVLGIHNHIGSQITESETFTDASRVIVDFVKELRQDGISIKHVNFGGGFGVQYRDYVSHPLLPKEGDNPEADVTTVKLLEAILPILEEAKCTVLIQPGRSIIAHAGILLTKVVYRKEADGKTFIITDAGMNDLIRPSLYQSYHQIVPIRVQDTKHEVVDIVGPLCESGDFFAHDRMFPTVQRGEYLAVLCAGAYGYVLASNYNGRPKPAEVLVDGQTYRIIKERESMELI